jgi:RpiB/LacA/LacB family sugar-phosphate isomerase
VTAMIAVGSDHGGVELKNTIVELLRSQKIEVQDFGTNGREPVDYPDFAREVALRLSRGQADRGVLVCTTGVGMSIVANKYPGVRAALVHDADSARMSREHNDANILVLSGAKTDAALAQAILNVWLNTPFTGGRHQRRIDKIGEIERQLISRDAKE